MHELETSLHLFQPPLYQNNNGRWNTKYSDAVDACGENVTIDPVSIASILSFGWVSGDRTLLKEIKRRPWLSSIGNDGKPVLENIPEHGLLWEQPSVIADRLIQLLYEEANNVCRNRKEIYILLTGGLDSRIIAGILARMYHDGNLPCKPITLTWGLENSRDAIYAQMIAGILDFEWYRIDLNNDYVRRNIKVTAYDLGCMHTPECMHSTLWLEALSEDALVLAGSYGDSVGRAEFGGKHLLELSCFNPLNKYGLLKPEIFEYTSEQLLKESYFLHNRSPGEPEYVICEHEMQGFRMRGGLGHAMTIINKFCSVYQMFTSPDVYGYMWSLHPSLRNDEIYAIAMEKINNNLARIPWARTNRALKGRSIGVVTNASRQYHEYTKWSCGSLSDELNRFIQPEWFEATGLFDLEKVRGIANKVKHAQQRIGRLNEIWLWLASFRYFVENLECSGKSIEYDIHYKECAKRSTWCVTKEVKRALLVLPSRCSLLNKLMKSMRELYRKVHKYFLRHWAIQKFPPERLT